MIQIHQTKISLERNIGRYAELEAHEIAGAPMVVTAIEITHRLERYQRSSQDM